jgi:GT2 family glycosyltransferase
MVYSIIVTFNGANWICNCLDSLLKSTIKTQIIVIDNSSTDDTLSILKRNYPTVFVIENNANVGFGRANNLGIDVALKFNPEYVFLLNQDAWVQPDTIQKLIEVSKKHKNYGILSPLHLSGDEDALDYKFVYHLAQEYNETITCDVLTSNDSIINVKFVNAAIWLIKTDHLKKIGKFDSIFFHYGEDNDFANRVLYHGFKIGIYTQAIGFHGRDQNASDFDRLSSKVKYQRRMVPYLIIMMNINNSFFMNLKLSLGLAIGEIMGHAKRFKWMNIAIELLSVGSVLIFDSYNIIKHREQNKSIRI